MLKTVFRKYLGNNNNALLINFDSWFDSYDKNKTGYLDKQVLQDYIYKQAFAK